MAFSDPGYINSLMFKKAYANNETELSQIGTQQDYTPTHSQPTLPGYGVPHSGYGVGGNSRNQSMIANGYSKSSQQLKAARLHNDQEFKPTTARQPLASNDSEIVRDPRTYFRLDQGQGGQTRQRPDEFGDKVEKQIQVQQSKHIKKQKKDARIQREPLVLKNHLEKIEKHEKRLEEREMRRQQRLQAKLELQQQLQADGISFNHGHNHHFEENTVIHAQDHQLIKVVIPAGFNKQIPEQGSDFENDSPQMENDYNIMMAQEDNQIEQIMPPNPHFGNESTMNEINIHQQLSSAQPMFGMTINTRNYTKTSNKLTPQTFNSIGGRKQMSSNLQNETILDSEKRAQQDFTPPSFEGEDESAGEEASQAMDIHQIVIQMVNQNLEQRQVDRRNVGNLARGSETQENTMV